MAATEIVGAMPPPTGVTPDFSGRRTELQDRTIVIFSVMTVLSSIFIFLRVYTRAFLVKTFGLDDFLIILSWLGCIAWFVACVHTFQYGFGEHLWNVPASDLIPYAKMLIGICVIYVWTPALTKFSLLVLYHRINPSKWMRIAIYAVAAIVFSYSLAITIVVTGPCNPLTHADGKCLRSLNLFMSIINIVTDFLVLALPIPMIHMLQLPVQQKVMIGGIFSLGSCVTITSIVRIIYVYYLIGDPDSTFQQAAACLFSVVELNSGVICGCLVILKPFFQQYVPLILSFSSGNRSRSGSRVFGFLGKDNTKRSHRKSYQLKGTEPEIRKENGRNVGIRSSPRAVEVPNEHDANDDSDSTKVFGDSDSTKEIVSVVNSRRREKSWVMRPQRARGRDREQC